MVTARAAGRGSDFDTGASAGQRRGDARRAVPRRAPVEPRALQPLRRRVEQGRGGAQGGTEALPGAGVLGHRLRRQIRTGGFV